MKRINYFLLFFALALISCERDDICAEGTSTTPRLIIEFFDATEQENLKNAPKLSVYGEGLATDPTDSEGTLIYNTTASRIELPLKIEDGLDQERTITRYVLEKDTHLRLDDDMDTNSNKDLVEISYSTAFVYVSRACGYKSIFNDLEISIEGDGVLWIDSLTIDEQLVENENTVHVRIFH